MLLATLLKRCYKFKRLVYHAIFLEDGFGRTDKAAGALTACGKKIIAHTPTERFGMPEVLPGPVLGLLSPASKFGAGVVVPADGEFSVYRSV